MLNNNSGGLKIKNSWASEYLSSAVRLFILIRSNQGTELTLMRIEIIIKSSTERRAGFAMKTRHTCGRHSMVCSHIILPIKSNSFIWIDVCSLLGGFKALFYLFNQGHNLHNLYTSAFVASTSPWSAVSKSTLITHHPPQPPSYFLRTAQKCSTSFTQNKMLPVNIIHAAIMFPWKRVWPNKLAVCSCIF